MRHTEDWLSEIFNRSNDAIFVLDPSRDEILDVNPKACDMLGYTRDELLSIGISAVHPDEMPKFLSFANSVYQDQYGWTDQLNCYTRTGEVLPTEISASTVELDNRPCIVAMVRDISERKRDQEALRRSEEEARLLAHENSVVAEIGRVVSFSLDIHDVYEHLGHQIRKLIPFDRMMISMVNEGGESVSHAFVLGTEVPGRQHIPLAGTFAEEAIRRRSAVMLEADKEQDLRERFPGLLTNFQDGMRSFLAAPLFYRDDIIGVLQVRSKERGVYSQRDSDLAELVANQIAGAIANSQLYAEHQRAEEALRQSEERYRDLYEHTPVMMHSIDSEARLVSVNDYWLEALGYERSEVIGRRFPEFLTEASRRYAVEVALPEFMKTGLARDLEYQIVKKNGDVIEIIGNAILLRDKSGEIDYSLAYLVDVTDRKRSEESRRQLTIVEERNRIAREIHDTLAQSLMGIVMQIEAAGELMGKAPEAARTKIELAGNLARESVEEARRSVWELQPSVLTSNGLTEAIQQEVTKTGEKGIQIALKIRGEEPDLLHRRNGLAVLRIVQEALSNIVRHARTKSARVTISYGRSDLQLSISDDGIGFDSSASHAALSSTGAGFGLISMQERARLAGGYIEIQSTPDVGTEVRATIPYQPDTGKPSAWEESPAAGNLPQDGDPGVIRVLIADDHEVFRRGILHTIEQIDGMMVVGEAEDGEDAVEKIQTLVPDVVLLDIRMTKLDGVGTLLKVRELGLQTRVILLSVYATDEYIFDGLRAGADGYLLKDVKTEDLANAIRTVYKGGSILHPVVTKRLIEQLDNRETSGLSAREIEVIRLLASGGLNKEISNQLSVTIHTVKFHLANIYRKLGVQTRAEAVRVASERGILTA